MRKILFLVIALPVFLFVSPEAHAQKTKNVLILNSYHDGFKWTNDETRGAIAGLDPDRNGLKIFIEYMGTKWAFDDPYFEQLRRTFRYKFRKIRFDIIIATDDDAFNFLKRNRDDIFPNAPVVFCGVNWFDPGAVPSGFKGYTGVNEGVDIPATLDLMLKIHPGTKKIYVVDDMTTTGKRVHAEFKAILPKYRDRVSFTFLEDMDMGEILDTVGRLGTDSLVLMTLFHQDRAGTIFEFDESTSLISKKSRVPVYGLWDFDLGFGIVGGMLTSGWNQGMTAGQLAARILKGEEADAIPVLMKSPNRFMFDNMQMQRFGIRSSDLPPGSTVINKPASFYDLHKGLVQGTVSGFLSLTAIIVLLLANIRQRREGEKALRESEAKVRTLLTNINVGVYRATLGGRFIQANPAMAEIFGYETPELFMETPIIDLYQDPEDRRRFLEQLKPKEAVKDVEIAMQKKDGTPIWTSLSVTAQYDKHGAIIYMDGVLEDITERKQAKEALQKAHDELEIRISERTADLTKTNEMLQTEIAERQRIQQELERRNLILTTVQETALDGIIVVDETNTIVSHNRRFIDMWGIPPEFVEAREDMRVWQMVTSRTADPEGFAERIKNLYEHREEESHEEIFLKDKRVFEHYTSPMIGAAGTYFGRIWYFRDITDRKKMQEEILKAQKLESMGVLAGGIAHDFNNLLTGIMGNVSLAGILAEPGSRIRGMLEKAEKASLRAKELAQQLLTFSRGGAPVKRSAFIGQLVKESVSFSLRGSNVTARFFIPEDIWPVDVDAGQMSQVINNLVINANQAMPDGGIITVRAENAVITQDAPVPLPPGKYVKISFQDQGFGISEANIGRIFDPYFTTKTSGSGLGLTMVYSIIKKHGGCISVDSRPGTGTVFHFHLPASDIAPQLSGGMESLPPRGEGKILVMDDEEIIREIAGDILCHLGYEVESCKDGGEAIRMYEEALCLGQPYAAVLMDLTIPGGMGGKETIARLMEIDPQVRVIVSSGYSSDPVMAQYEIYGFRGVVSKPYNAEELSRTLSEVINHPD